jgi:hypothetical protein
MKYNKDDIYSTANTIKISVTQTGSTAIIKEKHETEFTKRQGYRVMADNETIGFGPWDMSRDDLLLETLKKERYAHLAYKELYYDLLKKLGSIGLVLASEEEQDERF